MSFAQALLLGVIQGLSEFLPISSTAHLTLAGRALHLINPSAPEQWTAFIAVIQLGTLVAVLAYFRKDLLSITGSFVRENVRRTPFGQQSVQSKLGWYIIIGTIPVVVLGLSFKHFIEGAFTKNLMVIGISLVTLAIVLEVAERTARFVRPMEQLNGKDSIFIGFAQALALIPGCSRSGSTITAGLFAGLTRESAARFSFLLSIPAVAASGLLEFVHALKYLDKSGAVAMAAATVVAGVTGYWSIAFLLRYLRTNSTQLFIIYRVALGGAILCAILSGHLKP